MKHYFHMKHSYSAKKNTIVNNKDLKLVSMNKLFSIRCGRKVKLQEGVCSMQNNYFN